MLYITSLELITGNVYLLTNFIQFSLPLLPASGNHRFDLFSMSSFVCFQSIAIYNTILVLATQQRDLIFLYISK